MRNYLETFYNVLRVLVLIGYVLLWLSAFIEILNEGYIGGVILWITFGILYYFVVFELLLRNPNKKRRYSSSSGDNSIDVCS